MTDQLTSVTVISQGGLDSTENHLMLDTTLPGGATRLVNYEVGLYGGYRRLDGYEYFDAAYPTVDDTNAEGKILGLAIYKTVAGVESVYAARKQKAGNTYKFYKYTAGVGWVAVVTGFTHNTLSGSRSVTKIRVLKISIQGTSYIIFTDGVNKATVFDGTTWTQPSGDQSLNAPLYSTAFYNHIFFSGDATFPDIVYHSAPEDPLDYAAASGAGQLIAGYKVNGIKAFREDLYVFGNQNIKKINVDSTTFVINDVATNIGTIAPDSIIEMDGDILFLSQDGVRTVSGTAKIGDVNLASISKQIQQLVNTLQDNYDLEFLNSTVIKKKSQFRYFISGQTLTSNGVGLIGGLRSINGSTIWEFSELSGIRTTAVENDYLADVETTLHGDFDGSVYIQESGDSFNGDPVVSIYSTPYLTFGDVLSRKTARKIHTFIKAEGPVGLSIEPSFNWTNPRVYDPLALSFSADTFNTVYDDPTILYDGVGVIYDNIDTYPIITKPFTGSFNSMSITYTTSSVDSPHTIQGFIVEFNPEGTRTI